MTERNLDGSRAVHCSKVAKLGGALLFPRVSGCHHSHACMLSVGWLLAPPAYPRVKPPGLHVQFSTEIQYYHVGLRRTKTMHA